MEYAPQRMRVVGDFPNGPRAWSKGWRSLTASSPFRYTLLSTENSHHPPRIAVGSLPLSSRIEGRKKRQAGFQEQQQMQRQSQGYGGYPYGGGAGMQQKQMQSQNQGYGGYPYGGGAQMHGQRMQGGGGYGSYGGSGPGMQGQGMQGRGGSGPLGGSGPGMQGQGMQGRGGSGPLGGSGPGMQGQGMQGRGGPESSGVYPYPSLAGLQIHDGSVQGIGGRKGSGLLGGGVLGGIGRKKRQAGLQGQQMQGRSGGYGGFPYVQGRAVEYLQALVDEGAEKQGTQDEALVALDDREKSLRSASARPANARRS
ncbi:hypothetical protein JTE90_028218 [Oedothorax gibbosus]|uniref:Uncharacterized protein n=1 Tax=Oedothorax gibbosus TaxID=931172 RepID=A0AAV6TTS4_9ARAC|nr:hypothetical protein JTE90_028218 [Oedothorax gibbosus]KAG8175077.1 hypothetical protein JTE90_028218 [Oedothorax gibbosus]